MSDLIDRQKAVDAVLDLSEKVADEMLFIDAIVDEIENIPSAEPEWKWIPVTEALPEICQKDVRGNVTFSKQVWTCQKYGNDFFWQSIDQYTTNNGGGWLSEVPHDDPNDCCKVVAWMPLPEPAKIGDMK